MNPDPLPDISVWIEATRDVELPIGIRPDEALDRARQILEVLEGGFLVQAIDSLQSFALGGPDVLYGICHLLEQDEGSIDLSKVEGCYRLVSGVDWQDSVGERQGLLARVSFLAWDLSRKADEYAEARTWRKRCGQHSLAQADVQSFLSVPFSERSIELSNRFLGDRVIALACWDAIDNEKNNHPAWVAREGAGFYEWLQESGPNSGLEPELRHFLSAGAACSVRMAKNYLADPDLEAWSQRGRHHASETVGNKDLLAMLDFVDAVQLSYRYEYSRAELMAVSLVARFESLDLPEQAAKARFLLAGVLKDQGKRSEALDLFEQVADVALKVGDLLLACLAFCERAQAMGIQGKDREAAALTAEARALAERSGSTWAEIEVGCTVGELLRDQGDFNGSAREFTKVLHQREKLGMKMLSPYLRLVLAETLLLAGRPAEAAAQVVLALPMIQRESRAREGIAAVAILKEAVRQQADPKALRQLREHLQRMKEEGRL